jgi:hypothetical protein
MRREDRTTPSGHLCTRYRVSLRRNLLMRSAPIRRAMARQAKRSTRRPREDIHSPRTDAPLTPYTAIDYRAHLLGLGHHVRASLGL